ncbi:hypothetical protein [Curtobacterium sp. MCBD17_040]|uniref:hypothetical protein n=1 Tax=Curtobacterium sp. MCBD17_040 TaxID=2175674 RepID=UPI0011B383CD|nr:hypothetical protein [Curtobacterium sp. MCBD17_040]WIB63726.1 hypothetical protein DEI94_00640 [Curtobacterium sp. MCBD17_040]
MHALLTVARIAKLSSTAGDRRVFAQVIDVVEKLDAEASTAEYATVLEKMADLLTRWRMTEADETEAVSALRQLAVAGPPAAGPQPAQ